MPQGAKRALSFVLQTRGCWAGTAITFQDLFGISQKHSVLNHSCLKLKEQCLKATGDPDPGALHCGCGQSMLYHFCASAIGISVLCWDLIVLCGFGEVFTAISDLCSY